MDTSQAYHADSKSIAEQRYMGLQPPNVVQQLPPARCRLVDAKSALSGLYEALDELEKRLAFVVVPAPPAVAHVGPMNATAPSMPESDLTGELAGMTARIEAARNRVASLSQRIEV